MNEPFEIKLPKFLLATEPKKEYNGIEYIYSPSYLSLIMIIHENYTTSILNAENREKPRKSFEYNSEKFLFVIIQNNVISTGGHLAPEITEIEFLEQAYDWYKDYLIWEDKNIDEDINSKLN